MSGRPIDQTHNHFLGNIISPPTDRLSLDGIQTVRLLGPFRVSHDTVVGAGVFGDTGLYIDAFALPDGSVVLDVWAEIVIGFSVSSAIYFAIGSPGDTSGSLSTELKTATQASPGDESVTDPSVYIVAGNPFKIVVSNVADLVRHARSVSGAVIQAYLGADNPTNVGEADIYALIATPST